LNLHSEVATVSSLNNGKNTGQVVSNWINSESPIISSLLVDPFYLNDKSIYVEFIKYIKDFTGQIENPLVLLHSLHFFSEKMFGIAGNQAKRESIYLDNQNEKIPIADFYGEDAALCSERSSSIHNLLIFCGVDAHLIVGELKIQSCVDNCLHAYNLIRTKKDKIMILFDATNPIIALKNEATVRIPAFHILNNKAKLEELTEVNFDLQELTRIYDSNLHTDEQARTYYFPAHKKLLKQETVKTF